MMEVWDPKDKPTVFSQIKKAIGARTGHLKTWVVCLYPGILIILVLMYLALLPGCATMKWPWEKEIPMMDDNPDAIATWDLSTVEPNDRANTIACIKLQPECNLDQ